MHREIAICTIVAIIVATVAGIVYYAAYVSPKVEAYYDSVYPMDPYRYESEGAAYVQQY
jgi:hypothetical protein